VSDARDPRLSDLYRASATEAPPDRVDAAVLAAARAAVRPTKPSRPGWSWFPASWAIPVSLAAVVVMTFSIALLHREQDPAPMPQVAGELVRKTAEQPADAEPAQASAEHGASPARKYAAVEQIAAVPPREPDPAAGGLRAPEPAEQARAEERVAAAKRTQSAQPAAEAPSLPVARAPAAAAASPVPPASPPPTLGRNAEDVLAAAPAAEATAPSRSADPATDRRAAAETAARARAGRDDAVLEGAPGAVASQAPRNLYKAAPKATAEAEDVDRKASPPASASVEARRPAPVVAQPQPPVDMTPEQWIEHIERLRREGRTAEAAKSLEEFRRRHPSHPLPKHLQ